MTTLIFATFRGDKERSLRLYVDGALACDYGVVPEAEYARLAKLGKDALVKEAKKHGRRGR